MHPSISNEPTVQHQKNVMCKLFAFLADTVRRGTPTILRSNQTKIIKKSFVSLRKCTQDLLYFPTFAKRSTVREAMKHHLLFVCISGFGVQGFYPHHSSSLPLSRSSAPSQTSILRQRTTSTISTRQYNNWLGDLWDEVIEFSTYGPSERRILKARREAAKAGQEPKSSPNNSGKGSMKDRNYDTTNKADSCDEEIISLQAFQAAKKQAAAGAAAVKDKCENDNHAPMMDGYALRDLLVQKWGIPLDVGFQRGASDQSLYVTVLPVAFGNKRQCRHETELDYLMHLQAVIEIMHKYDNLEPWLFFLEHTSRVPKPGIESVPFRLTLSPGDQQKIMGGGA